MDADFMLHYGPALLGVMSLGFLTVGLALGISAFIGFRPRK